LALEFVLVVVVILLELGARELDAARNFLPDHALCEQAVLDIGAIILVRHSGLLAHELLELIGVEIPDRR